MALFDHRECLSYIPRNCSSLCCLLDMPICDGVEACKRLRIIEGKRKVPILLPSMFQSVLTAITAAHESCNVLVVALSADCQESTKQLCLSSGMNGFLSKPLRKGTTFVSFTWSPSLNAIEQPICSHCSGCSALQFLYNALRRHLHRHNRTIALNGLVLIYSLVVARKLLFAFSLRPVRYRIPTTLL